MTESPREAVNTALFARIRQWVEARQVAIEMQQEARSLRLRFADDQRMVITFDPNNGHVWLATPSGGSDFLPQGGGWYSEQHGELFVYLPQAVERIIACDPRNACPPGARATVVPPIILHTSPKRSSLRPLLLLGALLGGAYWMFSRPADVPTAAPPPNLQQTVATAPAATPCESRLPDNGSIALLENGMRLDSSGAEVTLVNEHAYPLLFYLTRPHTVQPVLSMMVQARQQAMLRIPPGQYDMMFSAGMRWCDARRGFSDGRLLKFGETLTLQNEQPVRISLQSSGAAPEAFQALVATRVAVPPPPAPSFSGDGSMLVQRHINGHFYLPGSVAGVPVTFMLDTGASVTSVSSAIARAAGLGNCKPVEFQTANGAATGCLTLAPEMTLGNFTLKNVTVAVMPNMETNLLGANVLRNFHIGQDADTLLIGRN